MWDRSVPVHPIRPSLVYVEVPKAGCTSVKMMLAPLKGGGPEPWEDIHQWFGYTHADDHHHLREWLRGRWADWFRFTVVRDPITRFESYFHGRQVGGNINDFALNRLRDVDDIHAARQTDLLGYDLSCYDFVGRLEEPELIEATVSEVLGMELTLPWLNRSRRPKGSALTPKARRSVRAYYRADFELLGYK